MKKVICFTMLVMFAMTSVSVAYDVPQPWAGKDTIAAPELLDGPEVSTDKTIQDGEVSKTTEKLIEMGVIPAEADQQTQSSN